MCGRAVAGRSRAGVHVWPGYMCGRAVAGRSRAGVHVWQGGPGYMCGRAVARRSRAGVHVWQGGPGYMCGRAVAGRSRDVRRNGLDATPATCVHERACGRLVVAWTSDLSLSGI